MLLRNCTVKMKYPAQLFQMAVLYKVAGVEQASIISQLEKAPVGAFFDRSVITCSSKADISAGWCLLYTPNPPGLYR